MENENIKLSASEKLAITSRTPDKMPLNPTAQGWTGSAIRAELGKAILLLVDELQDKLEEVYNTFSMVEAITDVESLDDETLSTGVYVSGDDIIFHSATHLVQIGIIGGAFIFRTYVGDAWVEDSIGYEPSNPNIQEHIAIVDGNPHGVDKTDLGLSNVENYGIASQVEAVAGEVNNKYMTPLRTKEAIDAKASDYYTQEQIDAIISGVYKPSGSLSPEEIVSGLLIEANIGNVYNITGEFTSTVDFKDGGGKVYAAGTNLAIVLVGEIYMFDVLMGYDMDSANVIYNGSNVKDEITNLKATDINTAEEIVKGTNYTDYVKDVATLNDIYFTYNDEEVSQELVDGWNVIGAVPYEYRGKIGTNRGSVVTDGTSIYIIGGAYASTDGGILKSTNLMLIYNIVNNSWKSKELPYYMRTTSAVYEPINKDIYIMGGVYNTDGSSVPTMFPKYYKYNTITEIFTEIATPPVHFAATNGINLYNGTHIIIPLGSTITENAGVFSGVVHNGEILSYEISTNTWTQIATQPYKTHSGASAIIDDILYIQRSKAMNDSYFAAYNLINNTWNETPLALPNRNVVHMTGIEYDGKYMISGGYNTLNPEGTYYGDIQIYNPATNTWSTHSVLNNKIGNGIGYGGFVKIENEGIIDLYYINGITNSGTDINEEIVDNEHLVYKYSQKRVIDLNKVLNFKAETYETSVTIGTADWVADGVTATYKAIKTVNGVLSSDNPIITFDLTGIADNTWTTSRTEFAKIGLANTTDDNEITFYASAKPTKNIAVIVKVVR